MQLSVIIPVKNEMSNIKAVYKSIFNSNYKNKEVYFVDAGSTDGTYEWLAKVTKNKTNYYLDINPKSSVSHGFNLIFPKTKGKYISRLDGHSIYPKGYFEKAIGILERNEADVVGGPAHHEGKTWKGKAIAKCMMHPFGVGKTSFRTQREKKYVDTIPFPIYKRSVFEKVGLYDEELFRNQDDELNYRCREKGYRILMDPDLETIYYVRENLKDLWNQYFQYGLYKPLVLKKVPSGRRLHHFAPPLFTISIPVLIFLGTINWFFFLPIFAYFILLFLISISIQDTIRKKLYSLFVFPCLHLGYGLGYIIGLIK
tara:strand:+ start:5603 stop:6541 length:939 start_codon:yes stop_codon:yes gene_type:complete